MLQLINKYLVKSLKKFRLIVLRCWIVYAESPLNNVFIWSYSKQQNSYMHPIFIEEINYYKKIEIKTCPLKFY